MDGEIQLIMGPMFCSKTSELIGRIRRYTVAGMKCVAVKYSGDVRYDNLKISTHDLIMWDAISSDNISTLYDELANYDVIGIDEGQFFKDINEHAEKLANLGKIVIIAALSGSFQREKIGNLYDLIPKVEKITMLRAVCMECKKDGAFTQRIGEEKEQEIIGGIDKYRAVCRNCFNNKKIIEQNLQNENKIIGEMLKPLF
jgi:thymidine kinase